MSDEWLDVLLRECERTTQTQVARRLGVSPAVVNQVLKGCYRGNNDRIEALVRGTFMREMVECPVLGTVTRRRCLDEQMRPFASTNPQRIVLWKACRAPCPNAG